MGEAEHDEGIVWDIVAEHLDEADFLVADRELDLESSEYTLDEIEDGPERRLRAHLDGLLLAGDPAARELLWPAVSELGDAEQVPRATAAALALVLSGKADVLPRLRDILIEGDPPHVQAISAALVMAPDRGLESWLRAQLEPNANAKVAAIVLRILAQRHADPGASVDAWLREPSPEMQSALLAAAGVMPRRRILGLAEALVGGPDATLASSALVASLLHGSQGAWPICRSQALAAEPRVPMAPLILALAGDDRDRDALADRLAGVAEGPPRESLVFALGFAGRPREVALVLGLLADEDERVAKLAGEAFGAITGAPIHEMSLDAPEPDAAPTLEEDDLDADLVGDPVDAMARLDPEAARAWWAAHASRFAATQRYLYGRVASGEALLHALRYASMRRRHVHALELALRTRATLGLPTRAWAHVQKTRLAQIEGSKVRLDLALPYARISAQ